MVTASNGPVAKDKKPPMPARTVVTLLHGQVQPVRLQTVEKRWFDRLLFFKRVLDLVEAVDGDVVECGVYGGESLGMLASLVRSSGAERRLWAFDSWSGMPLPTPEDQTTQGSFAGKLEFADVTLVDVLETLGWYGFGNDDIGQHVRLVQGYFSDTLPSFDGHISLIHIDADLYESYRDVMCNLWPKLNVGGIMAFDEYHDAQHWPGAKRAVDEFLDQQASGTIALKQDEQYGRYYAVKLT